MKITNRKRGWTGTFFYTVNDRKHSRFLWPASGENIAKWGIEMNICTAGCRLRKTIRILRGRAISVDEPDWHESPRIRTVRQPGRRQIWAWRREGGQCRESSFDSTERTGTEYPLQSNRVQLGLSGWRLHIFMREAIREHKRGRDNDRFVNVNLFYFLNFQFWIDSHMKRIFRQVPTTA